MAKILEGIVVSTKMQGTVGVKVETKYRHTMYQKVIKKNKNFLVANSFADLKEGQTVQIIETKPISKNVHFKVLKIMEVKTQAK